MTLSNTDKWEPVESLPARPLLVEELSDIESQYQANATIWIETHIRDTKVNLDLGDVGGEMVINFIVIQNDNRYQYRFDGNRWMTKGPFPNKSVPTWYSEVGSLWTTREKLLKRWRFSRSTNETDEFEGSIDPFGSQWETDDSLPSHLATLTDLIGLKDTFERAYGTSITVWIDTGLIDFYSRAPTLGEIGDKCVRRLMVKTRHTYYQFEFNVFDLKWKKQGPIPRDEWNDEHPTESAYTTLEEFLARENSKVRSE